MNAYIAALRAFDFGAHAVDPFNPVRALSLAKLISRALALDPDLIQFNAAVRGYK